MNKQLKCNGEFVTIHHKKIHIFRQGDLDKPKLVFLAGSATVAPVYDFKVLYEKLANDFRIIVIEKFGYGYSDIFESSCDIDTIVSTEKQALDMIGETKPYILVPHSMSGLEAIRWKQKYPDDIMGIIGIDMATPLAYRSWTDKGVSKMIKMIEIANKLKLYKIPLLYPLNNRCLTKNEIIQQKLLMNRNAFNQCYMNEGKELLHNVRIVSEHGTISCPTLLFSSNGKQIDKYWVKSQKEFAELMNAKLITYDCGHYIHYYKSNEMRTSIINFVNKLKQ